MIIKTKEGGFVLISFKWCATAIPFGMVAQNKAIYIRVSQIAGVFQKLIFESCTLYHIMPFAKIIGPVEKKSD